ncbi:MAG: aldehyde dehydrogenase family protein [Gammaproteobacteria bacterium]|jgi:acyl-CoA reductase-like NAD-dependent aldehyde dehydrogenase|nr:aldehyde dehydrogenase family protein [Gammaproteobacteria bacterium]
MSAIEKELGWHNKAAALVADIKPVIAGKRISSLSDEYIQRDNPATESSGIQIQSCTAEEVDIAVKAARAAYQNAWSGMPLMQRKMILGKLAELLMQNQEELALMDSLEVGKPISSALMEVQIASAFFSYYAEAVDKLYGRTAPCDNDSLELQTHRPRGVVAALTPWNFPVINVALKAAPILAAGNTLVLKPSEYSILSALRIAELALEAGIPEGVFNVVTGAGETGNTLVQHRDINMLTFTGSTDTGKRIMQAIGSSAIKPMLLECGGNNPQLVFADMVGDDLQGLVMGIVQSAMMNQGQVCVARSRLLVEESVFDTVSAAVTGACKQLQPADPLLPETGFGPLANSMQYDKVMQAIGNAKDVELVLDGRNANKPDKGYYCGPTVFHDTSGQSTISQEEIFGPVLSITPFKDEQHAVQLANDTKYGLAATVWTKDLARGHRLPQLLNAGWVAVNASSKPSMGAGIAHSHEPYGQSGFGVEGGMAGLESYCRLQTTSITHG